MFYSEAKRRRLQSRAKSLATKFAQGRGRSYVDEAIILDREALRLCPPRHPMRAVSLTLLSIHLSDRYRQLGRMEDLQEAINVDREALALRPLGNPDRSISLSNLARGLSARYTRQGEIKDINEAVFLGRQAQTLCPQGHAGRSAVLDNLSICLSDRYDQLGKIEDFDEALSFAREALTLRPLGHPDRSASLNNLTSLLSHRYKYLGAAEDLKESISLAQEALALCPPENPDRSTSLNNLSICLFNRYKQSREVEYLSQSINLDREALALRPLGHPDRLASLNNLASRLYQRYKQHNEMEDLNEAVVLTRDVLYLCPSGHPDHSMSAHNLASYLSRRYEQLGEMEDLDEAITLNQDALTDRPPNHTGRSRSLRKLAQYLRLRFQCSNRLEDKEGLFNVYAQMVQVPQGVSFDDLSAAKAWVRVAEHFQHHTVLLAYRTSLQLLIHFLATLPPLPQHLDLLKDYTSLGADAFSACLRHNSPIEAVELLEQGHGVFLNQLIRLRSPLDDVKTSGSTGKELAEEFEKLTLRIRDALASPGVGQHDCVWQLNVQLEKVVSKVRKVPGFSHFLLPLSFSDLRQAANEGPVIIVNASVYSCDALVILHDLYPVHIPLKITRECVRDLASELRTWTVRAKLMFNVGKYLASILRNVWDEIVSPIVDILRTLCPLDSRIWWCPTSEFTLLPLHAAGPFRRDEQRLADFFVSSYTSTFSALIRPRHPEALVSATGGKRFVGIGTAKSTGESELLAVSSELANIGLRVKNLATFTKIEGSESCIARVTEELNKSEWVHLACHGLPNRKKPFESAFALYDGHFTTEHIMRCESQNAQFAYLSACHTTVGSEESPDDLIHLASAMQFAGFRSVIGTMWAVDDGQTNKITSMFYDNMIGESDHLDHTRAAFALHKTMKEVRDISFDQRILYVHLGA